MADWKASFHGIGDTSKLSRAKKLSSVYISFSGLYTINVSNRVVDAIEAELNTSSAPRLELFDDAVDEVTTMLVSGALLRFWTSHDFSFARVSELGAGVSYAISDLKTTGNQKASRVSGL